MPCAIITEVETALPPTLRYLDTTWLSSDHSGSTSELCDVAQATEPVSPVGLTTFSQGFQYQMYTLERCHKLQHFITCTAVLFSTMDSHKLPSDLHTRTVVRDTQ